MRITLAAVGRAKGGPAHDLYREYAGRLRNGPFGPLVLKEVVERRPLPAAELKVREADLLLAALPRGCRLVALDPRGKILSSDEFAQTLGRWREEGIAEVAFAIGGAEGLDERVCRAAALTLSLGPMTWPHLVARALLAEQIYRAQGILAGHPYHRR